MAQEALKQLAWFQVIVKAQYQLIHGNFGKQVLSSVWLCTFSGKAAAEADLIADVLP